MTCRSGSLSWSTRSGYASASTGTSAPPAAVAATGIGRVGSETVTVAAGHAARAAPATTLPGTPPGTQTVTVKWRPAHRYS